MKSNEFVIPKSVTHLDERSRERSLAIRVRCLWRPSITCNLLSERCKYFYCIPPNFNKVSFPFFHGCTHDLFDQWNYAILCVGFLSTSCISFSLLLVVQVDCMVSFRCAASVDPVVGVSRIYNNINTMITMKRSIYIIQLAPLFSSYITTSIGTKKGSNSCVVAMYMYSTGKDRHGLWPEHRFYASPASVHKHPNIDLFVPIPVLNN